MVLALELVPVWATLHSSGDSMLNHRRHRHHNLSKPNHSRKAEVEGVAQVMSHTTCQRNLRCTVLH